MSVLNDLYFLSASLGGFFFVALLLKHKMHLRLNRHFLGILFLFSLALFLKSRFTPEMYERYPKIWFFIATIAYLPGILWYYLALDLKKERKSLTWDHGIGLIPMLFQVGVMIWILPKSSNDILQMRQYEWYTLLFYIYCATVAFTNIWFFWVTWRKGHFEINSNFSKVFKRFTALILSTLIFWCTSLIIVVLFTNSPYYFIYLIIEVVFITISLTTILFALAYMLKPEEFNFLKTYYDSEEYYALKTVFNKIVVEMSNRSLFLDPKLSLALLSQRVGASTKITSKAIKYFTQSNFPDYINRFRINHFIEGIENGAPTHFDIWGLAQESGFGNKMSFYESFKKHMGSTPGEYIRKHQPEKK